MSRVKQKALFDPPSQELLEGGSDSARPFTSYTVASFPADTNLSVGYFDGVRPVRDPFHHRHCIEQGSR
jgi:hypothetical protein